jgi:hypothetical protein
MSMPFLLHAALLFYAIIRYASPPIFAVAKMTRRLPLFAVIDNIDTLRRYITPPNAASFARVIPAILRRHAAMLRAVTTSARLLRRH